TCSLTFHSLFFMFLDGSPEGQALSYILIGNTQMAGNTGWLLKHFCGEHETRLFRFQHRNE
ncbi:MAG: hypothetical protein ABGW78_12220, partial [Pirellulales bacterium]